MEYNHINEELKYFNINYSFENVLSISLNQIFHFLDKDNIKSLTLCNKKIYQIYYSLVKKLNI